VTYKRSWGPDTLGQVWGGRPYLTLVLHGRLTLVLTLILHGRLTLVLTLVLHGRLTLVLHGRLSYMVVAYGPAGVGG
jgi:hypothetical protein